MNREKQKQYNKETKEKAVQEGNTVGKQKQHRSFFLSSRQRNEEKGNQKTWWGLKLERGSRERELIRRIRKADLDAEMILASIS